MTFGGDLIPFRIQNRGLKFPFPILQGIMLKLVGNIENLLFQSVDVLVISLIAIFYFVKLKFSFLEFSGSPGDWVFCNPLI